MGTVSKVLVKCCGENVEGEMTGEVGTRDTERDG